MGIRVVKKNKKLFHCRTLVTEIERMVIINGEKYFYLKFCRDPIKINKVTASPILVRAGENRDKYLLRAKYERSKRRWRASKYLYNREAILIKPRRRTL